MKSLDVNEIHGVKFTGGISKRFVLKNDNMGFAMMQTNVKKGGPYLWHYTNHKECCYCISGYAILHDIEEDIKHIIKPGICYLVDNFQKHTFTAIEDTVLISVFNPPLSGDETHDLNGNYKIL